MTAAVGAAEKGCGGEGGDHRVIYKMSMEGTEVGGVEGQGDWGEGGRGRGCSCGRHMPPQFRKPVLSQHAVHPSLIPLTVLCS